MAKEAEEVKEFIDRVGEVKDFAEVTMKFVTEAEEVGVFT